jgi:alanine racemase
LRPAWAEVDLGAVRRNAATMRELVAPAALCAVVKANGYGHGAVEVARAALEGGATWLAVALVTEGVQLREAGIDAPILVLSEPSPGEHDDVVRHELTPTVYTDAGIEACEQAAERALTVHLKIDTGMHRVGAPAGDAVRLAKAVLDSPSLELGGVWTHCAVADEVGHPATSMQCERFAKVLTELLDAGIEVPFVHAANSAASIDQPSLRHDLVRCGIALYGIDPLRDRVPALEPALSLKAHVSHVQVVPAGDAVSYGLRRPVPVDTVVATVPLGYADGVPRRLFDVGVPVLVGGERRPLAGVVTMDQLLVDCGPTARVASGDEVVLLGRQGDEVITAYEWADALGTIPYEVVCGIGPRVERRYVA